MDFPQLRPDFQLINLFFLKVFQLIRWIVFLFPAHSTIFLYFQIALSVALQYGIRVYANLGWFN